jgi:3-phenylpropionate/cinnamic acid dioxygenase small subunit
MSTPSMVDERLIQNGLGLFARILDGRQWDRIAEVFAENVTFNYGDNQEQSGIEAMRSQFMRFLDVCGPSQHLLGSLMLSNDGPLLVSRCYVQARHQGAGAKSHLFFDSNGEYRDRWERRREGWRIVRRDVSWHMQMGDPSVLGIDSN